MTTDNDDDNLPEVTWTDENRRLIELARKAVGEWDAGVDRFGVTLWDLHGAMDVIGERERRMDS